MRIDNISAPFAGYNKSGLPSRASAPNRGVGKNNHDILTISAKPFAEYAKTATGNVDKTSQSVGRAEHKERVERIKLDIQNGTYTVSGEQVAQAIIERAGAGRGR